MRGRIGLVAAAIAVMMLAMAGGGAAQAQARVAAAKPGQFDYYLLALSWSPTYCADPSAAARDQAQCGPARRYAFAVHGLWPQNEVGWPQDCTVAVPDVASALAQQPFDIMPSPRLVQRQWSKHGSCSGLSPQACFDLTRRMRAAIATPPGFVAPDRPVLVTAADVRARFIGANPRLRADAIAIACRSGKLQEVGICMTKAGAPRACGRDVRDRCEGRVQMPPVRAGASPARRQAAPEPGGKRVWIRMRASHVGGRDMPNRSSRSRCRRPRAGRGAAQRARALERAEPLPRRRQPGRARGGGGLCRAVRPFADALRRGRRIGSRS